ncbi:TRY3 protein, partial [Amia calva]|nr:TRY3 protein [Amia calva]
MDDYNADLESDSYEDYEDAEGSRIVGGVRISNVPYQASIMSKTFHYCGGALISPSWVLSAAHCYIRPSEMVVDLGSSAVWIQGQKTQRIRADKICLPPFYNRSEMIHHDIMLIKLFRPAVLGSTIQVVELPGPHDSVATGQRCLISGFGKTSDEGRMLGLLRAANVTVMSTDLCNQSYEGLVTANMMCAGDRLGRKDACYGDSGGPLICDRKLFGVISWGRRCGSTTYPGVYTYVIKYLDWIHQCITSDCVCR